MSTRATYQFKSKHHHAVTLYIHHDGYPAGAATYFWNAQQLDGYASLADRFYRANERAGFTKSHDYHGDTEYRYTVDGDRLTAEARVNFTDEWRVIFAGDWREFVNEHGPLGFMDNFEPIYRIEGYCGGPFAWLTKSQVAQRHADAIAELYDYTARFPHFTGNIASLRSVADRWQQALNAIEESAAA